MGKKNHLVAGGSGTGKTSVAAELERRGYDAIHGDRMLAYQGDAETGEALDPQSTSHRRADPGFIHAHHIWDIDKVKALAADQTHAATFFCGSSRNFAKFIHVFDAVFVLEVDKATLVRRLGGRMNEWGSAPAERDLILSLHASGADVPPGAISIDARLPISDVVDDILSRCALNRAVPDR